MEAEQRRRTIEEWMDLYGDGVLRTVYMVTGNQEASEEIAQDVFVRAWRKLGGFRWESSPRTWLYRIAVNLARNHLRTRRELSVAPDRMEAEAGEWPGPNPEAAAVADSERDAVRREVARLPVDLRSVVTLFYLNELPLGEIAAVLRIPVGTVKSRLSRARSLLRVGMEGDLHE
jgi:RNA polymerase sigma-70 factor (ECF subfamily)